VQLLLQRASPAADPHGLALTLGVTAEISAARRLLPASLIAAIFPEPRRNMPLGAAADLRLRALWYGVFNWFWFWLWREQPLRESLSLLYRELADYCEAKYSLLTQHTDPEIAAAAAHAPAEGGGSD
jgi:uncharacterized membrane protein YccC